MHGEDKMSLVAVVKGPEGVVLAADTRLTLTIKQEDGSSRNVNYDNATKILRFEKPHNFVAAVTYGNAVIGNRSVHSFTPEFELQLSDEILTISQYAALLSTFFKHRWEEISTPDAPQIGSVSFIVGGYDQDKPHGSICYFDIPSHPEPILEYENDFGMRWGGQLHIANRIIHGFDPDFISILDEHLSHTDVKAQKLAEIARSRLEYAIPYNMLPLQDCIDLVTFLIRATITAQGLSTGMRGVGGSIEVASITRTDGFNWVQKRDIRGESH